MPGRSEVPGERPGVGGAQHPGSVSGHFEATFVLHLVYSNPESASVAGHRTNGYATAKVTSPRWFKSKDAFMAAVCKAFEDFYDSMKVGNGRDGGESAQVSPNGG